MPSPTDWDIHILTYSFSGYCLDKCCAFVKVTCGFRRLLNPFFNFYMKLYKVDTERERDRVMYFFFFFLVLSWD